MKNTIEKALQRQQEEKARQAEKSKASVDDTHQQASEGTAADASAAATQEPVQPAKETSSNEQQKSPPKPSQQTIFELDLAALEAKGHISLTGNRSKINEEYREIKRKLLQNAFGALSSTLKNSNIIMVTSGRPSEGKTFTATNLALSIASEQDKTVLLVDADVLKPNVLRTLGLPRQQGLMEYLIGEVSDIAEVLYPTNLDKLKIIPAGKSHHLSTEFLASKKMESTIEEFANRYHDRVVVIDAPPLLGINETAILANFAGQAVVVVEENRAKLSDIQACVERLNENMAIGFVVNKSVNFESDGSGYYGYYGYAYAARGE